MLVPGCFRGTAPLRDQQVLVKSGQTSLRKPRHVSATGLHESTGKHVRAATWQRLASSGQKGQLQTFYLLVALGI